MIRSMPRYLTLTIASCALLLAGCGDTADKNEYVEKNNAIQTELQEAMSSLNASGDEQAVAKAQKSLKAAAADLEALDPPADWQDEHDDLVAAVNDMDGLINDMVEAAEAKDQAALTKAIEGITAAQEQATEAIDAMNADR